MSPNLPPMCPHCSADLIDDRPSCWLCRRPIGQAKPAPGAPEPAAAAPPAAPPPPKPQPAKPAVTGPLASAPKVRPAEYEDMGSTKFGLALAFVFLLVGNLLAPTGLLNAGLSLVRMSYVGLVTLGAVLLYYAGSHADIRVRKAAGIVLKVVAVLVMLQVALVIAFLVFCFGMVAVATMK